MPVRENFPRFEDIENSRPDALGAEIVLDLQKTPNEFFSPPQTSRTIWLVVATKEKVRPRNLLAQFARQSNGPVVNCCWFSMQIPPLHQMG